MRPAKMFPSLLLIHIKEAANQPCFAFCGTQMHLIAKSPENMPIATNSIVVFVVLCLFVLGGTGFAKLMEQRQQRRRDDRSAQRPT
jgi:hypothetical protein